MSTSLQDAITRLRTALRCLPAEERVRVTVGGEGALDSDRVLPAWQPYRVSPGHAVPVDDVPADDVPGVAGDGVAGDGVARPRPATEAVLDGLGVVDP